MSKTITLRMDDSAYETFKKAANGQKRSISNYIEYAAMNYLFNNSTVTDDEMEEILLSKESLIQGLDDITNERFDIIG